MPDAVPDSTEKISRWVSAVSDTRSTAKWVIASLAAVAAVVFGAGPIVSRPELSWSDDRPQLLVATVLGAAGLIAIVLLISRIATVLAPRRLTLNSIPDGMRAELDAAPDQRLPSDAGSYAEFLRRLRMHEMLTVQLPEEARKLQADLARLDPASDEHKERVAALASVQAAARIAKANRDTYREVAQRYLDEAEYHHVFGLFDTGRTATVLLAIVAALGGLGFQLALASDKDEPAPAAAAPVIGHLVRNPSQPAPGLWEALRLDRCANHDGEVPVLVGGGTGSTDDPYSVTTVQLREECPAQSFTVVEDAVLVRLPQAATVAVTYVPAATTTGRQ